MAGTEADEAAAFPRQEADAFSLTLTLGGRYAGEQAWTISPERGAVVVRVQTDFGGVLPDLRRVQTSRLDPPHPDQPELRRGRRARARGL